MSSQPKESKRGTLVEHLLKEMSQDRIPIGGQLPTEGELMERFSVSRGTVRDAITDLSSRGLVERLQGKGTFRLRTNPHFHVARPGGRTMLVGVWFNWPGGPFFGPIRESICEELALSGYHAVFENGGFDFGAERQGIEALVQKQLDGFVVAPSWAPEDDHRALLRLCDHDIPLVLVDRLLPDHEADLVTTNNQLGARVLTRHLAELGHRRIAFIGVAGASTMEERLKGYRLEMRERRLPIDEAWIQFDAQVYTDAGAEAAGRLASLPAERRPTGIFCANAFIAEVVPDILRDRGFQLPEDISIVGFDNIRYSPTAEPDWLTAYEQPKRLIGQQAARLLLDIIKERPKRRQTIMLEGKLIERCSTAPANGRQEEPNRVGEEVAPGTRPS